MSYEVLLTSRAKLQMATAAAWWAEHRSQEQAARWLDGFEAAIASLHSDPLHHPLARENALYELPYPVRQLNFGLGRKPTHRALFEVRGNAVYVVSIRHLAQDDVTAADL